MEARVAWGILGTGRIAGTFAKAVLSSQTGRLVGVGSRARETAERFAGEYEIPHSYDSYEALLRDDEVEAVYISLPNHLHAEWTIKCAEAGKHILCEKPLTVNYAQAMAVIEAVRYHDVFLMEAFMYRCHPQTARLRQLIQDGAVGEVRLIQANFSYNLGPRYENIRLSNPAAGGGIMDVGCYTMSMARLVAGAAQGLDVAEPVEVKGCAHIGSTSRVDEQATAALKFPGGIVANLAAGCEVAVDSTLRIWGSGGNISVPNPWFLGRAGSKIVLQRAGAGAEEISTETESELYAIEADTVARHLAEKQAPAPSMTWADSLGNMKALDQWRRSVGLIFDEEQLDALTLPVSRQPLMPRRDHRMTYGRVEGIEKPISRLVMGTMIYSPDDMPFACAMFDYFVEIGGTCFDTAYVYAGGRSERALGEWIRLRNNREQVVVLGKGAHTPYCTVEGIDQQIHESLERMQTEYFDLWLMHRDNLEVPVGEFVDCLNEHLRAGHIRSFGGSNWSPERLEAANDYARAHGLVGFAASSPNLSLAVWNEPQWEGCLSASDRESRAWYERTQMPLFSWSSQARGFLTGRFGRENPPNPEMVRVWYSEDNFARLERAQELARKKGVSVVQIAVAYVLCQPFPTFALIGPQSLEETRSSALGLDMHLTPEELRWLNLDDKG